MKPIIDVRLKTYKAFYINKSTPKKPNIMFGFQKIKGEPIMTAVLLNPFPASRAPLAKALQDFPETGDGAVPALRGKRENNKTNLRNRQNDVENRLVSVAAAYNPNNQYQNELYAYAPDNKRIWKRKPDGTEELYFYSISGQHLGTYNSAVTHGNGYFAAAVNTSLYFGSRAIISKGAYFTPDRVGSNRGGGSRYFPYGEEQGTGTAQDRDKFATYYRDSTTGLDYAQNRYYASTLGRFTTPDPFQAASAGPADPQSWNQYADTRGDPINRVDSGGLDDCDIDTGICFDPGDLGPGSSGGISFSGSVGFESGFTFSLQLASAKHADSATSKRPASLFQRVKDRNWIRPAQTALQSFNPAKDSPCDKDLKRLDVSADKIRSLAGNDRGKGGTLFVDAYTEPSILRQWPEDTDFDRSTNGEDHVVFYNYDFFWQTTYSQMLGTVMHELLHIAHYDANDVNFQKSLGLKQDMYNSWNISQRLADDCFKNATAPF